MMAMIEKKEKHTTTTMSAIIISGKLNKNQKMNLDHYQQIQRMRSSSSALLLFFDGHHHPLITLLFTIIVLFSLPLSSMVKGLYYSVILVLIFR